MGGLTSMFGGYNQESDDESDDAVNEEQEQKCNDNNEMKQSENEQKEPVENVHTSRSQRSQSVVNINSKSNGFKPKSRRTLSFDQSMQSQEVESLYNANASRRNSVSVNGFNNFGCVQSEVSYSKSGGIDDWVDLVLFIDELEDNADISISEGEELRQLALSQMDKLLIVYKCYRCKQARFIRYVRGILKAEKDANILRREKEALLKEKEMAKQRMSM